MLRHRRSATRTRTPWTAAFLVGLCLSVPACAHANGSVAPAATAAAPTAPAGAVVQTVHAWRDYLSYAYEIATMAPELDGGAKRELAEHTYLAGANAAWVRAYFATRGGGDPSIALGDWVGLPHGAFDGVTKALSTRATQEALERDAADLAKRFGAYGAAGDTTVFVFLVGDFSNLYATWSHGSTQVVAIQLENFLPLPADADASVREAVELAAVARPDSLPTLADVAPWAAYAATRRFVPELRERSVSESASLAEFALLHGFSARFAGALYPQSVFGRGVGALRAQTVAALDPVWRPLGASWFPLGTKPYSAARYEEGIDAKLPAGTTLDQALTLVGARMAQEWLYATRIGRTVDEPGQISRQGRVPTLSAWALLQP